MPLTVAQLTEIVDRFDWESYNKELKGDFAKIFGNIVNLQGDRAARRAGLDQWNNEDPFVQKQLTGYVGDRIVDLEETSKKDVVGIIREVLGRDGGMTTVELGDVIAEAVREKFAGYQDWRADRIARTETSYAYNYGNVFGYRQAGVEKVRVSDGDDDEECRKADGQIWTLAEALANPIAHPNCERDFSPIVE